MATLNWTNKVDDEDDVLAEDFNILVANIESELDNKITSTNYASTSKAGVVKVDVSDVSGLTVDESGYLDIAAATVSQIDLGTGNYPITASRIKYAVRSVRPEIATSIPPVEFDINTIYDLGTCESLALTLPGDAECGDFIQVDFYSGETPTTLTITSNSGMTDIDIVPETNTMYSLYFDFGTILVGTSSRVWGWRFGYSEYTYTEE